MIFIGGPNPMFNFNGGGAIGLAPQVRCFDVFYTEPVIAGLQVIGEDSDICNPAPVSVNNNPSGSPSGGDCEC